MTFTKKTANLNPIVDTVFVVARRAKQDEKENGDVVVNATIGSLYDENNSLVAFDSVFDHYNAIDKRIKAAYASSFTGTDEFKEAVYDWIFQGTNVNLPHSVTATPGGSGAISMAITTCLDENDTLLIPEYAWTSYALMAQENNYQSQTYAMFEDDHFNLNDIKEKVEALRNQQERIVIVINDPCHNPTGYSMTKEEWQELISYFNEVSKTNPCIIINDIAYIDYSNDLSKSRDYLNTFNDMSDNVMAIIGFSTSKSLTSYGLRCGAAIVLSQKEKDVRDVEIVFEKKARAIWSSIPNAAMENFIWVTKENKEAFLKEKDEYITLMKKRSDLFLKESKEAGLDVYPYKEGFFVTLKMKDNEERDIYHEKLLDNHIYTVKVNKGIRIALCSLPIRKIEGLAFKLKEIQKEI